MKEKLILYAAAMILGFSIQAQTVSEWKKDLDFLVNTYMEIYPQLDDQIDSSEFKKLINATKNDFTDDNAHNTISLFRVHAFLKDAHSVPMLFHPSYNFHAFPIRLYKFKESWYVIDAGTGYENIIGKKITHINKTSIDDIFKKSSDIISSENYSGKIDRFEMFGLIAEWLKDESIIECIDSAEFHFETSENEKIMSVIKAQDYINIFKWINITEIDHKSYFTFFNVRSKYYWYDYNKDTKELYFQFNSVQNQKGEPSIEKFTHDLEKFVNRKDISRFILDLRNNGGGDDSNLPVLLKFLKENKKINQYGKFYVLTGRHTFSSGLLFAWKLRLQTEAIFVGEAPSQGPIFNANADYIFLPNSKIGFTVSKTSTGRNQPEWVFKSPKVLEPDYKIDYSFEDFQNKIDPAIDFINKHSVQKMNLGFKGDIIGRYKLSDFYVANFFPEGNHLKMELTDFFPISLFTVKKELYFDDEKNFYSDRNGLFKISVNTKDFSVLDLCFNSQCITINRDKSELISPFEAVQKGKFEFALELFIKEAETLKQNITRLEYQLTMIGYDLLKHKKIDLSLKYFKFIIDLFPNSWNAYDSYAEALAAAGQIESAIKNYKKSVQLNPENKNGIDRIKKLEQQ